MSNEIADLARLSPEEVYGPNFDEQEVSQPNLSGPSGCSESEFWPGYAVMPTCASCHEQEVLKAGDVCSACAGGEN